MALPATLAWEIRSTGNSANGGAFAVGAVGSDYSMQSDPEVTYDGSTFALAASGAGSTLTCSGRPFVGNDTGNVINVVSGTNLTVGRYHIVSVASGTATLDRAVSTGVSSNGTGRLGGAAAAFSDISSAVVAGNTIWLQASGGYTLGASAYASGVAGTATTPVTLAGYTTERGDNGQATITAGDTTPTSILSITHAFWTVKNLILDAADIVETCLTLGGADCTAENITAKQWIETGIRATAANCYVQDCWATDGTGGGGMGSGQRAGFAATAAGALFERCATTSSVSNGFMVATGVVADVRHCAAWSLAADAGTGGHGMASAGTGAIRAGNCTFATLGGSGVYAAGSGGMADAIVQNCIIADWTRYAFESASSNYSSLAHFPRRFKNNALYDDGGLGVASSFPTTTSAVTLTESPFMAISTGDLDLNNAAGGGALCRLAGIPGTLLGLTLVSGGQDIGALQTSSGGTGHEEMASLWREWTGEFSTTRIPNTAMNRYLQSGLVELNRILGYAFADDTVALVAGTQEYTQPEGTVEVVFIEHGGKRLEKVDLEEWEGLGKEWRNLPASTPKQFAHYGNKLVLIPEPDAAAVAASSTITVRFLRSPRDINTYGPEGLEEPEWRTAVRWGAMEFAAAHPDSAAAQVRREAFLQMFQQAAAGAVEFYTRRRMSRGAASEVLGASGIKRGKS